jgi:hypothetical protein
LKATKNELKESGMAIQKNDGAYRQREALISAPFFVFLFGGVG